MYYVFLKHQKVFYGRPRKLKYSIFCTDRSKLDQFLLDSTDDFFQDDTIQLPQFLQTLDGHESFRTTDQLMHALIRHLSEQIHWGRRLFWHSQRQLIAMMLHVNVPSSVNLGSKLTNISVQHVSCCSEWRECGISAQIIRLFTSLWTIITLPQTLPIDRGLLQRCLVSASMINLLYGNQPK